MENNYNKKIGKVYSFDGEAGLIVAPEHTYNFSKKDILYNINKNDMVDFIPNQLPFGDETLYIAREIEKHLEKKLTK